MNNIFKVIWNHATQTWTAVGELTSSKGKSKSVKLAVISTALLAVAGGAQAADVQPQDDKVKIEVTSLGGLTISTGKASDQYKGNSPYYPKGKGENIGVATVKAYDGIAIGNGAVSGGDKAGGNAHVAIGLMSKALGGDGPLPTVAVGAYSVAKGQGDTAVGGNAYAEGGNSVALGKEAKAMSGGATALGNGAESAWNGVAIGSMAKADILSVSIGTPAKDKKQNSAPGVGTVVVGSATNVDSGRDGAVVLGYKSDATLQDTKVEKVNEAEIQGLKYSGFKGNLENADKSESGSIRDVRRLQGHLVSVGSKDHERQIKHVAAGKISDKSTDAINGSQLYSVADTITTAIKNVLGAPTDGNTDGVTLSGEKGATSTFSRPVNTIIEDKDYEAPEDGKKPTTVAGALQDLNNYVNAGWKVGNNDGDKVSRITPNGQVNFKQGDNIKVEVKPDGNNKANVTYSLAKDIKVDSVTVGEGSNTTEIKSDQNGLKLNDKKIQGVQNGEIKANSTDAVNGGQLHTVKEELTKQINDIKNLNNNNQSGAFDRLERKINKQGKEARAGIAGANAAAALPQVYTAGKAMVAAAAGTFKGQNALAVGYSRASDNGKVIFKLQGNANTSGDVGAGVGVGYQW